MKRLIPILAGCFAALSVQAQSTLQQYISQAAGEGALAGTPVSIMVRDMAGNVMASHSPDTRLTPASNTKLITTGCALHAFGPDYRFKTGLGYSGCIENGTLEGDLYIVGGGDPTIGTKDSIALKADALFWKWKTILKGNGIERIHGRIIGDGSAYEGHLEHTSWDYEDTGTYYGTGGNALCFYENTIDMDVRATEVGAPIGLVQTYPETPWLHLSNMGVTGPKGSGNSLYLFTTDLAPYAQMRGTFAIDRRPKTENTANKYGDLTCAYYFWKNLKDTGWEVTGGYARVSRAGYIQGSDFVELEKAGKPREIGFTESPTLAQIARITNERSDNFYAEYMLRAMGESATGIAVYASCLVAESLVLKHLNEHVVDSHREHCSQGPGPPAGPDTPGRRQRPLPLQLCDGAVDGLLPEGHAGESGLPGLPRLPSQARRGHPVHDTFPRLRKGTHEKRLPGRHPLLFRLYPGNGRQAGGHLLHPYQQRPRERFADAPRPGGNNQEPVLKGLIELKQGLNASWKKISIFAR